MKTKLPFMFAAGLFYATLSMAQYGGPYAEKRVVIQGQVVVPGHAVVAYGYNNDAPLRYDDQNDRRDDDNSRYEDRQNRRDDEYNRYNNPRDWRAVEYERYCQDHRHYRMGRQDFYRDHCRYPVAPYCAPRRVVVYSNY